MKKRKKLFVVLLVLAALFSMTLSVSEADAAASASDFVIKGSTLTKYQGSEANVTIPDTVDAIGQSAFEGNTHVESVVIPDSVKRIDGYAFWGCDQLGTVTLGKGLTEIGDYAFAGCTGLKQMTIPQNITTIGAQAFGDCTNLTDITIPPETVTIHETAFDGCAKLTIHCDEGSAADTFAQIFYEKQKTMAGYSDAADAEPTPAPTQEPTPEPTQEPGTELGSTTIVGNSAVVMMNSDDMQVRETGTPAPEEQPEADAETPSERPVSRLPKYRIIDGQIVADQAFYRNDSLADMILPAGITEIGQFAFARSSLVSMELQQGVTDICYGAFYHCDNLEELILPDTVMNVEPKAFDHTAYIENFKSGAEEFLVNGGVLLAYSGNNSQVAVPGGVRVIAAEVFSGHGEIESVRLPDSLQVIGEAAFGNCESLKKVTFGDNILQIKDRAFNGCDSLEVIKLPASVKEVGLKALGKADVVYMGERPEETYETSATRLSNEAFRNIRADRTQPGVTVTGIRPAAAELTGAATSYLLRVTGQEDSSVIEKAWTRAMQTPVPKQTAVYELRLTDNSDIPLMQLGRNVLTVTIPIPAELAGQELEVVTLDRNGQLETVDAERVILEETECLRLRLSHTGVIGIYGK